MNSDIDSIFMTPPVDGIAQLPQKPGIYAMLNRITRMINVGQSGNIKKRCLLHRNHLRAGTCSNMRMRRDAQLYGADVYLYYVLELLPVGDPSKIKRDLNRLELWWVVQLQAHDEQYGYLSEAGHCRTRGARWRDRERKLMRASSQKYQLLAGVDIYDAIHPSLLATWVPGS